MRFACRLVVLVMGLVLMVSGVSFGAQVRLHPKVPVKIFSAKTQVIEQTKLLKISVSDFIGLAGYGQCPASCSKTKVIKRFQPGESAEYDYWATNDKGIYWSLKLDEKGGPMLRLNLGDKWRRFTVYGEAYCMTIDGKDEVVRLQLNKSGEQPVLEIWQCE